MPRKSRQMIASRQQSEKSFLRYCLIFRLRSFYPSISKESPPVWPDLAQFRHFGKFLTVYFLFGKMLNLLLQISYIFGLIFIVAEGQILKNNLTIWSHWSPLPIGSGLTTSITQQNFSVSESATRWRDNFSIIGHLQQQKFAQWH